MEKQSGIIALFYPTLPMAAVIPSLAGEVMDTAQQSLLTWTIILVALGFALVWIEKTSAFLLFFQKPKDIQKKSDIKNRV